MFHFKKRMKKDDTLKDNSNQMFALRPQTVDFDAVWGELQQSVVNIIELRPITRKVWDHKFSDVYNICVAIPEPLCDKLYKALVACIENHVQQLYQRIITVPPTELLAEYAKMWKVYYEGALYVHMLFGYLNKQFVKSKRNLDPDLAAHYAPYLAKTDVKEVGCMALDIWKSRLVEPIFDHLLALLLAAIADDRAGNPPENKSTVNDVIMSFIQIEQYDFDCQQTPNTSHHTPKAELNKEFYQENFEIPFLRATEEYYTLLAQKLLSDMTCSQYMEAVIQAIDAEKLRSSMYVYRSTVDKVIKLCQNVMISAHKEKLNGVCSELIKNEERKDLRNMYKLMKPIEGGLTVMIKEFEEYVKKRGHEAINNLTGDNIPQQFVENILQVYDRYSEMKTSVFTDDGDFTGALDKALQSVVNTRTEKPGIAPKASERLARYANSLLSKNARGMSETEMDDKLSRAIIIFRYIEDKDVFQRYYSKMLSTRLINNISVSMDAEESMINKLKVACGYEFTSKLSRMFTDIGLCPELSSKYEEYLVEKNLPGRNAMAPIVLTAGSWPLNAPSAGGSGTAPSHVESVGFILPLSMKASVDNFQAYYLEKHNGRRLSWLFHASHGELRTSYLDKAYVIQGSAFQMATLMCFNHHDTITVTDLGASTGLTGELVFKIVKTLMDVNLVTADDKELVGTSKVALNTTMSSKRIRFKLPAVQSTKQVEKEVESVNNTVAQDRKYYIECAVVRIMKTRKVLKHPQLINEVMDQIKGRFKPDVSLVKKCIEDLIDKMYLQRTDKNDEYQYLA